MPSRFAFRGERLAFSAGIVVLALIATIVLVAFGGRVEALIPLYAVGVFTSITISQTGMVRHWLRARDPGWRRSAVINAIGAIATGIVTVIFAIAKFALGAWLIIVIIPVLLASCSSFVASTIDGASRRASGPSRSSARRARRQHVVVPVPDVTREVVQAVQVRSHDVRRCLGRPRDRRPRPGRGAPGALRASGARDPVRDPLESPYRQLVQPLIRYFAYAAESAPSDVFVVLLPEYVPRHWWERLLYNDNGRRIRERAARPPERGRGEHSVSARGMRPRNCLGRGRRRCGSRSGASLAR